MKNSDNWRRRLVTASGIAAAGLAFALPAMADSPVSMAPPVDGGYQQVVTESTVNNGGDDTVFLWSDVPNGQEVTITRAVFDRGGYQLYDDVGETIVVPFSNNNLYVMKFGVSDNGHMYFVDDNGTPILFVPRNGYLENATVSGARWYPFTQDFHPTEPVYLGVAPSWNSYVTMGWYPDMYYSGGYWCNDPYLRGGIFEPSYGLEIVIGNNHFRGWTPYHDYYYYNPAPYRVGWYNRDHYSWATQPHRDRQFWGGGDHWSRPSRPTGPTSRWETFRTGRSNNWDGSDHSTRSWNNRGNQSWGSGGRQTTTGRTSDTHTWRGGTSTGSDRWNGSTGGTHTNRGGTSTWSNGGGGSTSRGGDRQSGGGTSTWSNGGGGSTWRGGDRQTGGGTSTWSNGGGGSTWRGGDRQSGGGTSTWQGRSGGSFSTGGSGRTVDRGSWQGRSEGSSSSGNSSGRSSGGWSGGGRTESNSSGSSRGSGGGGRWTR